MTYSFRKLLIIVLFLVALLITACGSAPMEETATDTQSPTLTLMPTKTFTATPAGTSTPTTLEILQAKDPDFKIIFNDEGCTLFGPMEITRGEYLVVLHNQTELPAVLWMEKGPKKQAHDGITTYYKVYDVKQAREHSFWVSLDRWWGWLCAPIQVSQ